MPVAEPTRAGAGPVEYGWRPSRADLVAVCAEASLPTLVAQPIVDLARGCVVGFEVLSRFPQGRPDTWFAAAVAHDMSGQLDAKVLARAGALRAELPANTFLTVNIEPQDLLHPAVMEVLDSLGDLSRLVVELTEHARLSDMAALTEPLGLLRERGALIAADDVGAGYAGLQALLALRPEMVKIDRSLVDGIDEDPAKQAVVRMLGELSSTIDAWVLAEGVEREEELVELIRLGVPMAQGYLLGRPGPDLATHLPVGPHALIVGQAALQAGRGTAAELMEVVPLLPHTAASPTAGPRGRIAVEVDSWGRPITIVTGGGRRVRRPLVVQAGEEIRLLGRRVASHSEELSAVVVVDGTGRTQGVIRPSRLLGRLAESATS